MRYGIEGPLSPVFACHCNQCRRVTGHHVAATVTRWADVTIAGNVTWFRSSAQARRGFCGTCGSQMFWDGFGDDLAIFAGGLDGDPGVRLAGHVYCADKGAYYEIDDGLPQAPGGDSGITG